MGGRSASVQRAITDEDVAARNRRNRRGETTAAKHARVEKESVGKAGFDSVRAAKAAARQFAKGAFDKDPNDSPDEARRKAAMRRKVKRIPKHYYSEYVGAKRTQKANTKNGKATKPKKTAKKRSAEQRQRSTAKRSTTRAYPEPRVRDTTPGRAAAAPPVRFGEEGFNTTHRIIQRQASGPALAFRSQEDLAAFNAGRR